MTCCEAQINEILEKTMKMDLEALEEILAKKNITTESFDLFESKSPKMYGFDLLESKTFSDSWYLINKAWLKRNTV